MTSRRRWLQLTSGVVVAAVGGAMLVPRVAGGSAPTPDCIDADEPTPRASEGPFFTPDSPERSQLREPATVGAPLRIDGLVVDRQCRPLARALVDVWSCDGKGDYDNVGYRLRGHQYTGADGRFVFETVRPVAYGSGRFARTPHVHLRLRAPASRLLTTQIYFPGEARNATDALFDERLLVALSADGSVARYRFVLDLRDA